ncbi:phospholipid/cholesterol/gamma-HCH transport system substrate-binding protein [Actinokineospora alba]|uniref:Phospholipid/cholesterol/gamma-HCH transport system substrate-binding protein n=1 Tax=Actinokineospora alba TaxID=504798 RepID=A0A1H0NI95_9PSEU|nr:MlaD family protein [Actinokineospora alba]TDP68729.1 phospholipid/cholesterol/gamma-HCH transport system substrate-binding protein [Actinokineospora alba]SDH85377.1 phospholipid/cholesterol/gamma-HCH transport system substrate-binding protein [Actinokineospora alba]SDO92389.1 phospholipid/cholesterol/gamma-HCH transport system substrate-binding protein [Actinokineospora alba]
MLTRKTKIQFVLFLVIAVVGVTYAGARYAGLDRLFGSRGYVVTVRLADSGGIFTNAEVAYRGVTIGRVGELRLSRDGLDVDLDIDPAAPPIPADVTAVVANRSAIGEQFVDLRPDSDGGPQLAQGSVIPRERTRIPRAPEVLLENLDRLVTSVPIDSLRTVVDELDQAFTGAGPQLQGLLDHTASLTAASTEHLPQTKALLADGRTVLATQQRDSAQILALAQGFNQLAARLKSSDPDLRRLITVSPQVADLVDGILRESGSGFGVVFANLLTISDITTSRKAGIEQILVAYPIIGGQINTLLPGDGTAHMGLVLNTADPVVCTRGYEGTVQRAGSDNSPAAVNKDAYCAEPPGSPINVRGSSNAPFPGMPPAPARSPQPDAAGGPGSTAGLPGMPGLAGPAGAPTITRLFGLAT